MTETNQTELSVFERNAADQALELFSELNGAQAERVLAYVQGKLNKPQVAVSAEDPPMFSRGIANPLGKLTCVAKTKVDEPTFELFLRHCATHGTDVATVLRDCIYFLVYGKTCQQMISERLEHGTQRTEATIRRIGPFGGPESKKS